jgi:hypothetical protein
MVPKTMIAAFTAFLALASGAQSRFMFQAAAPPVYGECSPRYASCGGVNWDGPTCCFEGDVCQYQSVYFSQCVPSTDASPPVYGGCAARAEQCGGRGWGGETCCLGDDVCVARSAMYSECGPAPSPSPGNMTAPSPSPGNMTAPPSPPLPPYVPGNKPYDAACAMRWDACGGENFEGEPCCNGDNVCVFESAFFSMCTPTELPATVAREFHVCGGKNWTGPTKCEALTKCTVVDDNTSLCMSVFPSPPSPPPNPPRAPRPDGCADRWGQCGGLLFEDRCCAPGNACVEQNAWYSQCIASRPLSDGVKGWWDNCGGPGRADDECEEGSECTVVDQWYSICLPETVA